MRLLVIGGTVFVGRAVAEAALARGHDVTVFHRGQHGEDLLPPEIAHRHGDRQHDLGALAGERWDAVVDTCGFEREDVEAVAAALPDAGHYTFVSSVSVFRDWPVAPVAPAGEEPAVFTDDAPPGYGAGKARAERAALSAYGDRALVVRPGLIVGPYENIGRLPFWLRRVARGGEVLAPGAPDEPRQWIDARDLAAFVLDQAEAGAGGVYTTVGPPGHFTMGELLDACRAETGADATFTWVPGERVAAAGIASWSELPVWLWGDDGPLPDGWTVPADAALAAGLRIRDVRDTVAATWAWMRSGEQASDYRAEFGVRDLDPERERAALR